MSTDHPGATAAPDEARTAWLTTLRPDGSPHTAPVWFVLADETFYVATSASAVKVHNLQQDPRASLALDGTGSVPWVAQGDAVVHDPFPDRPDVLRAFADRYGGWDAADPSRYGPRVLVEIPVGRWLMRP